MRLFDWCGYLRRIDRYVDGYVVGSRQIPRQVTRPEPCSRDALPLQGMLMQILCVMQPPYVCHDASYV